MADETPLAGASRRVILGAAFGTLAAGTISKSFAQTPAPGKPTYDLPPLPYDHAALEPVIDRETMELHHSKHHKAYVDELNRVLTDQTALQGKSIEELLRNLQAVPDGIRMAVRNNGGGHANHQLFWKIMTPGGSPMPENLKAQIDTDFGGLDKFKAAFEEAGLKQFGSGWVFLVFDKKANKLAILTLPNQDSVLFLDDKPAILANDLWEHAYYLKHRNRRADYLKGWWGVTHWQYAGERLQGIKDGKMQL